MRLLSPPPVLPVSPPLHELGPGDRLVRFYNPKHGPWDQQRPFGPLPDVRFDHHSSIPGRSVWYAATSMIGAVAEAFGNQGFIDKESGRRVCIVTPRLPLPLIDLVGVAARAFGLDQRIGTSTEYARCQEWAQAFYDSYPEIRGIRWRCRQTGSICVVLNDRAGRGSLELIKDCAISQSEIWLQVSRAARRARLRIIA